MMDFTDMPDSIDQERKADSKGERIYSNKAHRGRKLFRYFFLGLVFLCLLFIAFFAALPGIISSNRAKNYLEDYTSKILHQPVSVSHVRFSWLNGLTMEKIRVMDNPLFSHDSILSIDSMELVYSPRALLKRVINFELTINDPSVHLICNDQGYTNLEYMISRIKADKGIEPEKPAAQDQPSPIFALPFDLRGNIRLESLSLMIEDRKTGHNLNLNNGLIELRIPSFRQEPVDLELRAEALMDNKRLTPLNLSITALPELENDLKDLLASEFEISGRLLETAINIRGTLENLALEGVVETNLSPVMNVLKLVSGSEIPDISGHVSIKMENKNPSDGKMDFKSIVNCRDILVSGGPIKDKALGPVNIRAEHTAGMDLSKGRLTIRKGEISLQENSGISWAGNISLPKDSPVLLDISIDPLTLDLKEITSLINGFIPIKGSGNIDSEFSLSNRNKGTFDFKSHFAGTIDSLSGIPGLTQPVAFDFDVLHNGTFDPDREELHVNQGVIAFLGDNKVEWNGLLKGLNPRNNTVDITLGPCSLNLDKLTEFASKSIPERIPAQFRDFLDNLRGALSFVKFHVQGPVAMGQGRMEIKDLSFTTPAINILIKDQSLSAKDMKIHLKHGETVLNQFFPDNVHTSFGLNISDIQVRGEKPFDIKTLDLESCEINIKDLSLSHDSVFGFKGDLAVRESVQIEGLIGPSNVFLSNLDHSLEAEAVFGPGAFPDIHIKKLNLSSPLFSSGNITPVSVEGDFDISLGIRLNGLSISPDALLGVEGRIEMTESLSSGSIKNSSKVQISGFKQSYEGTLILEKDTIRSPETRVRFYSPRITYLIQNDHNPGAAILFETEVNGFQFEKNDSISVDADNLHMALNATDLMDLNVNAAARGLGNNGADLDGKIILNIDNPLSLLKPESLISPNINGEMALEWDVDRLPGLHETEQLLSEGWKSILVVVMKGLGLDLQASIKSDFMDEPENVGSIAVQGDLDASTKIRIKKGESVKARGNLTSSRLNLAFGDIFQVKNLQTNLKWEKEYSLSFEDIPASMENVDLQHLSSSVLRPWDDRGKEVHISSREVAKGIRQDLINRKNPGISFDYAMINTGLIPLEIRDHLTEIRVNQGLPVIDYFQAHILGGSTQGYLSIFPDEESFLLEMECSFTGINPNSIIGGPLDEEAELSGTLKTSLPVSDDFEHMLDDLLFTLDLTHIGSKTLERFLYILDPNDSNETIVKQRKLLRIGSPRWVSLRVEHGNLSLSGLLEVKGNEINLPPIDRLSIVNLPIWDVIEENEPYLNKLVDILNTASADRIFLEQDGEISLGRINVEN